MNPKLLQYRNEHTKLFASSYKFKFEAGFTSAIELNLAVGFAEWTQRNVPFKSNENKGRYIVNTHCGLDYKNDYSMQELYDYWLTNVWQLENK